jgi:hypothetical protein
LTPLACGSLRAGSINFARLRLAARASRLPEPDRLRSPAARCARFALALRLVSDYFGIE